MKLFKSESKCWRYYIVTKVDNGNCVRKLPKYWKYTTNNILLLLEKHCILWRRRLIESKALSLPNLQETHIKSAALNRDEIALSTHL